MWIAASQTLDIRSQEVADELSEYLRYVDGGGSPIGEWDGPDLLWDQEGLLGLELEAIEQAFIELNRATAISIYHHWERHVPTSASSKKRDHAALASDLLNSGIEVHSDIDALHFAANFLKHGTAVWLTRLFDGFEVRFPELAKIKKSSPAWWGTLNLGNQHIEWFFEIASASKRPILETS